MRATRAQPELGYRPPPRRPLGLGTLQRDAELVRLRGSRPVRSRPLPAARETYGDANTPARPRSGAVYNPRSRPTSGRLTARHRLSWTSARPSRSATREPARDRLSTGEKDATRRCMLRLELRTLGEASAQLAATDRPGSDLATERKPSTARTRVARRGAPRLLALTQGDPAGIGPELTLQGLARRDDDRRSRPSPSSADPDLLARMAARSGWSVPIELATAIADAADAFARALPVVPLCAPVAAEPGKPDPATAAATIASIETAVAARPRSGEAAASSPTRSPSTCSTQAGFAHPGPHRVSGGASPARPGSRAAAGDDAVVRGSRRRAGDHPHPAARSAATR